MHQLIYRDAVGGTQSFSLEALTEATLGRGPDRHLVLEGRQVSRHHATIERVSGSFLLRDLGSANGTFLNGLRLSGTSAISLRDGDVIEIGSHRLCFAAQGELGGPTLETVPDETMPYSETAYPYADLLRDGIAWVREHEGEPDEASDAVQGAFTGRSLAAGVEATLDLLRERLRVEVAAAFVKRRDRAALELVAARPDEARAKALAATFDITANPEMARLFHRVESKVGGTNLADTCDDPPVHSAALVPFFRGANLLGVLAVENLAACRIDRKHASIVAVYGERISRALMLRLSSASDTAFDLGIAEAAASPPAREPGG